MSSQVLVINSHNQGKNYTEYADALSTTSEADMVSRPCLYRLKSNDIRAMITETAHGIKIIDIEPILLQESKDAFIHCNSPLGRLNGDIVDEKDNDFASNYLWLFHGTDVSNIDKILANGFNRNYCNVPSDFGDVLCTYFAKDAMDSVKYCQNSTNDHNGDLCLLLCLVRVDEVIKGLVSMTNRSIPFNKDGLKQYTTLVNDINNPKIYGITRDNMAIPKYKIWFRFKQ